MLGMSAGAAMLGMSGVAGAIQVQPGVKSVQGP